MYKLDLKDMLPAVRDTIARGGSVRLPVAGSSMQPTMYPHRDWVTLTAAPSVLRRGDLPLYCRVNGSACCLIRIIHYLTARRIPYRT